MKTQHNEYEHPAPGADDWAHRSFAHALAARSMGLFKQQPEDFIVTEQLPFALSGSGEHLWVQLEKTALTTHEAQRLLSRWAQVAPREVAYSGLKDKWAQTRQWFSIYLPGKADPQVQLVHAQCRILAMQRHHKKLRIGTHAANDFDILLRQLDDADQVVHNLQQIRTQGVPNYFGEQRFGKQRSNLLKGVAVLLGRQRCPRHLRSIYLSALRSYLFNCLLSQRVSDGSWQRYLEGDVLQLAGSQSCFHSEHWDAVLQQRLDSGDIHISGLLAGIDGMQASAEAQEIERAALAPFTAWLDYFATIQLKAQRRSLRLLPTALQWQRLSEDSLRLQFSLPRGGFATAVLRELIRSEADAGHAQAL